MTVTWDTRVSRRIETEQEQLSGAEHSCGSHSCDSSCTPTDSTVNTVTQYCVEEFYSNPRTSENLILFNCIEGFCPNKY